MVEPKWQMATERYTELRAAFRDGSDSIPRKIVPPKREGAYRREISALIYETGKTVSVKNTRQIFFRISLLVFATTTDSLLISELIPEIPCSISV